MGYISRTYTKHIMKYLILCALFFGLAYASEDDIDIEVRSLNLTETIGTITDAISSLTGVDLSTKNNTSIEAILGTLGLGAAAGTGAKVTAIVTALSTIKTAALGLLSAPLAIANGILALIGLVLLIAFLVEGGDFLSLVGYSSEDLAAFTGDIPSYRSLGGWGFSDVINMKNINRITDIVHNTIDKYQLWCLDADHRAAVMNKVFQMNSIKYKVIRNDKRICILLLFITQGQSF